MTEERVLTFDRSADLEEDTMAVLMRCAFFAAHKHKNQKRKNQEGTPYINHPLGIFIIMLMALIIKSLNHKIYVQ